MLDNLSRVGIVPHVALRPAIYDVWALEVAGEHKLRSELPRVVARDDGLLVVIWVRRRLDAPLDGSSSNLDVIRTWPG